MVIPPLTQTFTPGSFPHVRHWHELDQHASLFTGLAGSADAFLIADIFRTTNRPLFVVVESAKRAESLVDECKAFVGEDGVLLFPSRDAVPYNMKSPFGPTTEARLQVLSRLLSGGKHIFIAPYASLLQKVPAPKELFRRIIRLKAGVEIPMDRLQEWLVEGGFRRENQVTDIGSFSVRGGIIDIYPFMSEYPLRCEFWGDQLESIREFDVFTQKSQAVRATVEIFPMRELPFDTPGILDAIEKMKAFAETNRDYLNAVYTLEHQWRNAGDIEGIEWFLHWFDQPFASILEYFSDTTMMVWDDVFDLERRIDEGIQNYQRHLQRVPEALRPLISAPEQLLIDRSQIREGFSLFRQVYIDTHPAPSKIPHYSCSFAEQPAFAQSVELLAKDLLDHFAQGYTVRILSANLGHAERLLELMEQQCPFIKPEIGLLHRGFIDRENKQLVYTDKLLFPHQGRLNKIKKTRNSEAIARFDELEPGDFVVHEEHGIAKFVGIERVMAGGAHRDCMVLLYAERGRLYVPVEDFHRVQKYIGKDSVVPTLSTLGTGAWERIKQRTKESIKEMAKELMELYAKRQYLKGIVFPPDTSWQKEFEDAFLYDETPDQLQAIKETKADMESEKPMDRLVCGDVGFGKTEVAMRAAFKAVMSGYQVAILAPTTILVAQHFATFKTRMANFPIEVGMLSRFLKPKEQKEVVARAREGKVNILIGTHRILSKDIAFNKLGLLIIDEEQRFGVKHKEKIKEFRFNIDVLSLTATPIPRTLHMSLIGARDLSVINTPPRNRLPIETTVAEYHDEIIKRAVEEELDRGGQVYLVDNRIKNLPLLQEKLEELVPRAKVITGHGQMEEGQLELVMKEFIAGRYDILLSTTIIENGLDIANVNTMIVNRADIMGLSQLYQLRGRVGRSGEQAYAYFLTPNFKNVTELSLKRLRALEQYTDLGSGFQIAMRDLELRGAGNILGTSQHGFIAAVGFELYIRLLKETMDEVQGKLPPRQGPDTKVEVECEAYIPTEYVADAGARVSLYQQLASIEAENEIDEMERSLADRFGPIPQSVITLLVLMKVKVCGRKLGVSTITIKGDGSLILLVDGEGAETQQRIGALLRTPRHQFSVVVEGVASRLKTTVSGRSAVDKVREVIELMHAVIDQQ